VSGYGRPQRSFFGMDDRQGRPASSLLWSDQRTYSTQHDDPEMKLRENLYLLLKFILLVRFISSSMRLDAFA
jgi:hypothetical protein